MQLYQSRSVCECGVRLMAATEVTATEISLVDELRRLSLAVNNLESVLRVQREALKQKGMSLPPGTLQGVQSIHTELDALAQALEGPQTELEHLRVLGHTAELINSTLDLDEVLNQVMSQAIQLIHAERGYLVLRDKMTGELVFRVARNITGSLSESEFIISKTIVGEVARTGVAVVTTNATDDERWNSNVSVVGLKLRSILCVPLLLRNEVTGVLYVDNRIRTSIFGDKEREMLSAFANQAAIAIENARLFERARSNLQEATRVKDVMDNVFASIGSGVITADANNTITLMNDAAERILEVTRNAALQQPLLTTLLPLSQELPAMLNRVWARNFQEALEVSPTLPGHAEATVLSLTLNPLKDAASVTQGVALVVDDLTEARRRDDQLKAIRRYLTPQMVDNIQSIDQLGLGGERREVTAMFIDVRGYSTFPSTLSPIKFMQVLNQYLTVAADQLAAQSGIIDKYMANEVMALFNTQLNPAEDHSFRAIMAALDMADEYVKQFYPQQGEPANVRHYRIGIHTGIATLGNAGSETRKEFTALGDSINLTHRLLENAQPGQIIISRETFLHCAERLAADRTIAFRERGQIQVKGRQQAVAIYEVFRR